MRPAGAGRFVVLYDGDCALCTRWRDRMARRDRDGRVEWVSVHDPSVDARFPGLDREDALRQMYVYAPDGTLARGADGWVALAPVLRGMGWLALLRRVPGGAVLMRRVYRFIAERRYRLSCAAASCRIPRGGGPAGGSAAGLLAAVAVGTALMAGAGCGGAEPDRLAERLAAVADPGVSEVLTAAFDSYGGYDAWTAHRNVEYVYRLSVYAGREEPAAISTQIHRFSLRGEPRAYIEDLGGGAPRIVRLRGDLLEVTRGGVRVTDPAQLEFPRALSRIARWSFLNPWNVIAAGASLAPRADRTPPSPGTVPADPCSVIRLRITDDGPDGGARAGDWHDFYFSRLSHLVDRIHSYRAEDRTYRVSLWSDHRKFGGIWVATVRKIYSSDERGGIGPLQAVAEYDEVRFDVPDDDFPLAASAGRE
ncbi:MAG: thiol-disulfide oxidoreductase DCC family protein [Acidobacteriota bacterium]